MRWGWDFFSPALRTALWQAARSFKIGVFKTWILSRFKIPFKSHSNHKISIRQLTDKILKSINAVCSGQNSNFFWKQSRRGNLKQCGRSFAETIFWGKDSAKLRLIPFFWIRMSQAEEEGSGEESSACSSFFFWRNSGGLNSYYSITSVYLKSSDFRFVFPNKSFLISRTIFPTALFPFSCSGSLPLALITIWTISFIAFITPSEE